MKTHRRFSIPNAPAIAILAGVLITAIVARPTAAQGPDQHLIEFVRLTPFVIDLADPAPMTLEVGITDSTVASLDILSEFCWLGEFGELQLRDDGSGGDKVAGDLVFTASDLFLFDSTSTNFVPYGYPRISFWSAGTRTEAWHREQEQPVRIGYRDGTVKETTVHVNHACGAMK